MGGHPGAGRGGAQGAQATALPTRRHARPWAVKATNTLRKACSRSGLHADVYAEAARLFEIREQERQLAILVSPSTDAHSTIVPRWHSRTESRTTTSSIPIVLKY